MSAAGDLRAVLTLDDFEYLTGLREASAETHRFAKEADSVGGKLEKAFGGRVEHKLTHFAIASSFMLSAGKEADTFAGKLEHILSVAPLIGSAFGPVGMAVGSAAALIGAALIPALEEAKKAAEEFGKEMEASAKIYESRISKDVASVGFEQHLKDLTEKGDPKAFAEEKKQAETRAKELEKEIELRKETLKSIEDQARLNGDFINPGAGAPPQFADTEKGRIAYKAAKEQEDKINEAEDSLRRQRNRAAALEKGGSEATNPQFAIEQSKKLIELEEKRRQIAERIAKEIETPYERAQERIRELQDAFKEGIIDADMLAKGTDKAIEDYGKSQAKQGMNAGAIGGSSESYKQIRESVNSQSKVDDEKIRLLREQAEAAKATQQNTERIADNINPPDVEGIA